MIWLYTNKIANAGVKGTAKLWKEILEDESMEAELWWCWNDYSVVATFGDLYSIDAFAWYKFSFPNLLQITLMLTDPPLQTIVFLKLSMPIFYGAFNFTCLYISVP